LAIFVNILPNYLLTSSDLFGLNCSDFILFFVLVETLGYLAATILAKAYPVSTLIASKNYPLDLTSDINLACSLSYSAVHPKY